MIKNVPPVPSDDIEALKANLALPDLPYVEAADESERHAVLQQWTLLNELHSVARTQVAK